LFAAKPRLRQIDRIEACRHWCWQLDKVYAKIKPVNHGRWRAVDHEGDVPGSFASNTRRRKAAPNFVKGDLKRDDRP